MKQVYLLSFVFILAFCTPLWYDASKRKEYGTRPRILLGALAFFVLIGVAALISLFAVGKDERRGFPLVFTLQALYAPLFFILEYSVHVQRINKNLLVKDFVRKALWLVVVVVVAAAALAGCWALNISLDFSSSNSGVYLFFIRVVASVAVSVSYLFSNFVFDLQKGIVRRVSYTFYTGAAVSTVVLVASWVADAGSPIFILLFMANNAVFAIRIFQEYFVYRMGHVNDIHVRQLEFEQGRTELLNRVLLSSPEEDVKLIGDTLSACREQFRRAS